MHVTPPPVIGPPPVQTQNPANPLRVTLLVCAVLLFATVLWAMLRMGQDAAAQKNEAARQAAYQQDRNARPKAPVYSPPSVKPSSPIIAKDRWDQVAKAMRAVGGDVTKWSPELGGTMRVRFSATNNISYDDARELAIFAQSELGDQSTVIVEDFSRNILAKIYPPSRLAK